MCVAVYLCCKKKNVLKSHIEVNFQTQMLLNNNTHFEVLDINLLYESVRSTSKCK